MRHVRVLVAALVGAAAQQPGLETVCSIVEVLTEVRASFEEWQKNDTDSAKSLEDSFREESRTKKNGMDRLESDLEESRSQLAALETESSDLEAQLSGAKKSLAGVKAEVKDLRERLKTKRQEYRSKQSLAQMSADVTRTALLEQAARSRSQGQSLAELGALNSRLLRGGGRHLRRHGRGHRNSLPELALPQEGLTLLARAPEDLQAQQKTLKAEFDNEQIQMEKLIEQKGKDSKDAKKEVERLSAEFAGMQEQVSQLQRDIDSGERSKERDEKVLKRIEKETQQKKEAIAAHVEARGGIISNLGTAVGTLQGSGCKSQAALLEATASLDAPQAAPASRPARAPLAPSAPRGGADTLGVSFLQTASEASDAAAEQGEDPFAGVKEHISEMIAALKQKINEDMNQADWCADQKTKTEEEVAAKQEDLEGLQASIREKKAQMSKLEDQVTFASGEVSRLVAAQAAALASLKLWKSKDNAMIKEHELAIQCFDQSNDILRKYYGLPANPQPQAEGASPTGQSLLDTLMETRQMTASLSELVRKNEAEIDASASAVSKDQGAAKAAREKERDDLIGSKADIADGLAQDEADLKKGNQELALIVESQGQLDEQCGPQKVSFEDRKKARADEIQALQDALKVLQGEALPSVSEASLIALPQPDKLASLLATASSADTAAGGTNMAELLKLQMAQAR